MKNYFLLFVLLQISIGSAQLAQEKLSQISFKKFLDGIEALPYDKRHAAADEFMKTIRGGVYPLFEDDSTAVLLYQGEEDTVYLLGDMTEWTDFFPLNKIEGTNLFYFKGSYEPDARLEYWLLFEKNGFPFIDPLNKRKSLNGLGELSVLAMPRYKPHAIFSDYEEGKKGELNGLAEYLVPSGSLGYDHIVHVYLPPSYDADKEYPAVYFQDGRDYIQFGLAPHIITELITENKIEPMIAVFVTPPNLHQPEVPNRMTEYGMNDKYVTFFTEELVGFIDSSFAAADEADRRLVVGDSYGGLISTYIAFSRPEIFKNAYGQSGYHSFSKDKMIRMIENNATRPIKLFVDIGTYEKNVGAAFLPEGERNFLEGNRRLKQALEQKNYDFIYKEYFEGHTWGNWRRHLIDALIYFYGTK